jgi:hypothetical protein
MATDDTLQVIMVPVKRYDITLTLDDILIPLTQTASNLAQAAAPRAALDPEVAQHLQTFTNLVTQLKDVVSRINQIDPSLLASNPGPPPSVPHT